MRRTKLALRNIIFGYIGNLVSIILGFILRTIFIQSLGRELLGINGLYISILSVLSLADLGIGTSMNFFLYEPVANKNYEKIKSYISYYKKAYRIVALIILVFGLLVIPFLKYIIGNYNDYDSTMLIIYYLIFLFNVVSTYFISYKYSIVNAEQKNYIQTNIVTITKIITVSLQIVVIIFLNSFLWYLLIAAAIELIQKIIVNVYLNNKYEYLKSRCVEELEQSEKKQIVNKVKSILLHKIGDVARLQTDSLIISTVLNVIVIGIVDNYLLIINSITGFINIIFNSLTSGFGNLIVTENTDKQFTMFKVYRFLANWLYGFITVFLFVIINPIIQIWIGKDWLLGVDIVALILLDCYLKGDRIVLSNFKTAAGVFEQDKYLALIQGIVNLIISVVLVQYIGLSGIYIGTLISGLIANITKPSIIYRVCFDKNVMLYFRDTIKYYLFTCSMLLCLLIIRGILVNDITIVSILIFSIVATLFYNVMFILVFRRTEECQYFQRQLYHKK